MRARIKKFGTGIDCSLILYALLAIVFNTPMVNAAPADNWYITGFGGVAVFSNEPFKPFYLPDANIGQNSVTYNSNFETGITGGILIGNSLDQNWRTEIEASIQIIDFDADYVLIDQGAATTYINRIDGSIFNASVLASLWHDFNGIEGFTPYVGGGLGIGFVALELVGSGTNNGAEPLLAVSVDESAFGLAFQLGTGIRTMITDNTYLDLGYRFRGVTGLDLDINQLNSAQNNRLQNLFTHTFQIGLTYKFK